MVLKKESVCIVVDADVVVTSMYTRHARVSSSQPISQPSCLTSFSFGAALISDYI